MRRLLGWMCWRIVMAWPGAWPAGALAGCVLSWAGDYANEPPNVQGDRRRNEQWRKTYNAKSEPTSAALSREVGSTDGL